MSFNFDSEIGNGSADGASLVAYGGNTLNKTFTGAVGYSLLQTNTGTGNGEFAYRDIGGGQLDNAQFGSNAGSDLAFNPNGNQGALKTGTALFDLSGFTNQIVNFRLAFGSNGSNNSDGIAFDNFNLTGSDCTGMGGSCEDMVASVPEPASLALAMIGLAGAYDMRKKRSA